MVKLVVPADLRSFNHRFWFLRIKAATLLVGGVKHDDLYDDAPVQGFFCIMSTVISVNLSNGELSHLSNPGSLENCVRLNRPSLFTLQTWTQSTGGTCPDPPSYIRWYKAFSNPALLNVISEAQRPPGGCMIYLPSLQRDQESSRHCAGF